MSRGHVFMRRLIFFCFIDKKCVFNVFIPFIIIVIFITRAVCDALFSYATIMKPHVRECDCRLFQRALDETAEQPYWKTETGHHLSAPEKFTFGTTLRKLAYSAQMYHYEQQKRRIIEEEKCVLRSATTLELCVRKKRSRP